MRFNCLCLVVSLFLAACSEINKVERVSVEYQLLSDDVFTRMPGNLLLVDDFLVWTDPFATDYFVHVHQVTDGQKVGVMGKQGLGPGEFVTPMVSQLSCNRHVRAVDVNGKTRGYLSIDSLLQGKNPLVVFSDKREENLYKAEDGVFVGYTEDGESFYLKSNLDGVGEVAFGDYPIAGVKRHIGGNLAYNHGRDCMVFASFEMPYLAMYKKTESGFKQEWVMDGGDNYYEIVNGDIRFDMSRRGIREVCMSKDYIIGLQRDYTVDDMDERKVGRDVSKCPRTVFLYDYDGNLLKILDLGIPVMRIASGWQDNTLYAIGADPEYVLVKFELW